MGEKSEDRGRNRTRMEGGGVGERKSTAEGTQQHQQYKPVLDRCARALRTTRGQNVRLFP